jgi:hypothetical protein
MSYFDVIKHIEKILNKCGDAVIIEIVGTPVPATISGQSIIEIKRVSILQKINVVIFLRHYQ